MTGTPFGSWHEWLGEVLPDSTRSRADVAHQFYNVMPRFEVTAAVKALPVA